MDEEARRESQARLKQTRNALNGFLAGAARAEFSSGDSLQGYTKDAALALRICLLAVYLMHPYELHCGIGTGEIYVLDDDTNASDGPAYHDALESLERSKREAREVAAHFGIHTDGVLNALLLASQLLKKANTDRQNLYVALVCLLILSHGDGEIMKLCLANAGFPGDQSFEIDDIAAEKRNLAELTARLAKTTRQNSYDMLKKSNALSIAEMCDTCVSFLSTT